MLADHFDAFLFDLDGVLSVGLDPMPGAVATITRLRQQGKALRFLTNDPRPTRAEVADRLAAMGMQTGPGEVVTAGSATAGILQQRGVATVYVVGSPGLAEEMRAAGIQPVMHDAPDAVVVGCDTTVGYMELRRAAALIGRGAQFIATNPDPTFPTRQGPSPATGAISAAVAAATAIRPLVIGKPAPTMFLSAVSDLGPVRTAMVGDTSDTDVLGAHQAGLTAILVARQAPAAAWQGDPRIPDATIPDVSGLFDPTHSLRRRSPLTLPWPEEVRSGVAAVVFDEAGDVLLVRRADNGRWGLPSGHVEPGETIEHAAVREVSEETGLHVRVSRLVGVYSDPASQIVAYPDGRVCHFITASFACSIIGGRLRPDRVEVLEADFFSTNELPTDLLRMHPRWLIDAMEGRTGAYR